MVEDSSNFEESVSEPVRYSPLQRVLPNIVPDINCPQCKGQGVVYSSSGEVLDCPCKIIRKKRAYLTPQYADAYWNKDLDISKLQGKNLILECNRPTFQSFVKSFLLNSEREYHHYTIFGNALFQFYFSARESKDWANLCEKVDIVILMLTHDANNKMYGSILTQFLEKRILLKLPVWIFAPQGRLSEDFQTKYSLSFSSYLEDCRRTVDLVLVTYSLATKASSVETKEKVPESPIIPVEEKKEIAPVETPPRIIPTVEPPPASVEPPPVETLSEGTQEDENEEENEEDSFEKKKKGRPAGSKNKPRDKPKEKKPFINKTKEYKEKSSPE
ncbi:MAG: hypothetical protein WC511_03055 [Candidatus Pacearchaeota archaeon]